MSWTPFLAGKEACERISSSKALQGSCRPTQLDISDPASVQQFVKDIGDNHSKQIYGLINNAGVYPDGWTQTIFDRTLATNFDGPISLAIGLAPHMKEGEQSDEAARGSLYFSPAAPISNIFAKTNFC